MRKLTSVLLPFLLLAGCDQDHVETATQLLYTTAITTDACAIALTPPEDQTQHDAIVRYQYAAQKNIHRTANLEKLGWAYVSLARNQFDDGYYQLAMQTVQCIEKQDDDSTEAALLKAHVLHQLHQFKQAEKLARQLVGQRGHWFEYALLGDALMEQGKLKQAELAYQSMMDQRPGPQAYTRTAHLRWLTGDSQGALKLMQDAVQSYGNHGSENFAWTQTRLAFYLFQAGRLDNARRIIDYTLSRRADYAPALSMSGRLYLAESLPQKAVSVLRLANQINPLPENQWLLIEALKATGQHQQADKIEAQLDQSGPLEDPRTYALYLATQKTDTKTALQLAAVELEKRRDVFSLDAMAWALYGEAKYTQALTYINRAVSESTPDARLFMHAALIHHAAGNQILADKWFGKAQAAQHLLLPSEKQMLNSDFATHRPSKQTLQTTTTDLEDYSKLTGEKHENKI